MPDFVTLTCPSCGGKLQITNDINRFACSYCGAEHIVRRSGGIVSLAPVVAALQRVQAGVDKTASELAITRLEPQVESCQRRLTVAKGQRRLARAGVLLTLVPGVLELVMQATSRYRSLLSLQIMAASALLTLLGLLLLVPLRLCSQRVTQAQRVLDSKLAELARHQEIVHGQ
jgi:hypothetical protein